MSPPASHSDSCAFDDCAVSQQAAKNGWAEYKHVVMYRLDELQRSQERLVSRLWGVMAGVGLLVIESVWRLFISQIGGS